MADRDEEIAELKRRLAALEASGAPAPEAQSAEPAPAFAPGPAPRGSGPRPRPQKYPPDSVFVLGGLALAGVAIAVAVLSNGPASRPAETPKAPEIPCDVKAAELAYGLAQARGLIRGVDMSKGEGVVVMVGARQWRRLDWPAQQRLAMDLDCGISGGTGHLVTLRFRLDRSGEDLAVFQSWDLMRLREAEAAATPSPGAP